MPGFSHIPYNDLAKAAAAINDETAAVLVEPVQGEGGVRPATEEYLLGLAELCRERGALLILDEVQTGFGRRVRCLHVRHTGFSQISVPGKVYAGGRQWGRCC